LDLRIKPAGPYDIPEARKLLDLAFKGQDNLYYLTQDPGYKLEQTRLILKDDELVGLLQIFERLIRWKSGIKRVGCLGNLTIHPEHRGKGYANILLEEASEYMLDSGFDYSFIFSAIPKFYERFEWKVVRLKLVSGRINKKCLASSAIRRIKRETDLKKIIKLYERFNEGLWGTVIRSEALWRSEIKWLFDEDLTYFFIYCEKNVEAYVRCHKNFPYIMEYGYEKGFEKEFQELLSYCSSKLRLRFNCDITYLPIVNNPEITDFIELQLKSRKRILNFQLPQLEYMMIKPIKENIEEDTLNNLFFWHADHF
jgi:predicted N-acetyltransferase YhbS